MKFLYNFFLVTACICQYTAVFATDTNTATTPLLNSDISECQSDQIECPSNQKTERCACNKPKPPRPKKEIVQDDQERCCHRPKPKPRSNDQELEDRQHDTQDERCCHRPRPRPRAPRRVAMDPELLRTLCELIQEECTDDKEALIALVRVWKDMLIEQEEDGEKQPCDHPSCREPRPGLEPALVGPGCGCDIGSILEKLEECCTSQEENFQEILKLLQVIVDILEICCSGSTT